MDILIERLAQMAIIGAGGLLGAILGFAIVLAWIALTPDKDARNGG